MFDRYDPRDDGRQRGNSWERTQGGRGAASDRGGRQDDQRDVFTKDLDLPLGRERQPVRERNRVYEINGDESHALATIGAFRVVAESDLDHLREVQELAGHKDLLTTQRYMHLSPAALEGAIRLLESSGVHRNCGDILETAEGDSAISNE